MAIIARQQPIFRPLPDQLCGERVVIRPRKPGDSPAIWEAIEESREQLSPWLPWVDQTHSLEDCEASARRAYAKWLLREDLHVCLWQRETGRFLGGSGLHRIQWDVPAFEIGYWLRTSMQGKGYITEAVRELCRFAFETLAASRVEIRCDRRNERSAAVPRRLGFVHEATLRNQCRDRKGELRDTLVFALIPEDYARMSAERSV
jgi:ribosomal-protein-serine acetyltransferase